jgi:hypothetical protein
VFILADVSLTGDEMMFSYLAKAKIGFQGTHVSRAKRARKTENGASIAASSTLGPS